MVARKHWFVMTRMIVIFTVLVIVPPIVLTFLPVATSQFNAATVEPLINLFLTIYIMIIFVVAFLFWMDYYLDMWIVTNQRIIDVEQRGLFNREISEIPIKHVQDITIEVNGVTQTFLKFGTIRIQTAGEREFTITDVPRLYELKDAIIKYSEIDSKNSDASQAPAPKI